MKSSGFFSRISLFYLVFLVFILASCIQFEREYPEQVFHVISIERPGNMGRPVAPDIVLQVKRCMISPRYKNNELVYQIGKFNFESDFYNKYFIPPQDMVSEEVTRWFQDSGVAGMVVDERTLLKATHALTGSIKSLYGDYRDGEESLAVMTIQFLVTRDNRGANEVLFMNTYEESVVLKDRNAESLITGLNAALTRVLTRLEEDLRAAFR